jgi:acetyl esterase/lipase
VKQHARQYHFNYQRLALMGDSAGGTLVSQMVMTQKKAIQPRAVVCLYSVFDLKELLHENPKSHLALSLLFRTTSQKLVKRCEQVSPIVHVQSKWPPFLLIHGDHDTVVPIEQSIYMKQALQHAGVQVKLIKVRHAEHALKPVDSDDIQPSFVELEAAIDQFIQDHLKNCIPCQNHK